MAKRMPKLTPVMKLRPAIPSVYGKPDKTKVKLSTINDKLINMSILFSNARN